MAKIDVVLNAFSCSAQAPCNKWKDEFFKNPLVVINVPGSGSISFRAKAIQWAKTGDLFKAAVAELAPVFKNYEINKRILTTFSVGWTFADELLKFEKELNRLDVYLLLDGCHTKILTNWIKFAKRAAIGEAYLFMAHSSIKPPFISSTDSNTQIYTAAASELNNGFTINIPDYILHAELPEGGITISLAGAYDANGKMTLAPVKKTWLADPLKTITNYGKMIKIWYDGNDRPDHVYIAWYVSKRLWRWLGEIMSEPVVEAPGPICSPVIIQPQPELPDPLKPEIIAEPTDSKPVEPNVKKETTSVFYKVLEILLGILKKV